MINEVINPVNAKIPVYGRLHHAYPLAVVLSQEEGWPWFYSNFIQLFCKKNFSLTVPVDLSFFWDMYPYHMMLNPWLNTRFISKNSIKSLDIVSFALDAISQGKYMYTYVDEYYIPFSACYMKQHIDHDFMLYGFNKQKQCFYTLGYDSRNLFSCNTVSFEQFRQAYATGGDSDLIYRDNIFLLKLECEEEIAEFGGYPLNMALMVEWIDDYLNCANSFERFRANRPFPGKQDSFGIPTAFGLETYECVIRNLRMLAKGEATLDIRNLHIIWEHKRCMTMRMNDLQASGKVNGLGDLIRGYDELEQKSLSLRNMLMKYHVTGDARFIESIVEDLERMPDMETRLLTAFRSALEAAVH